MLENELDNNRGPGDGSGGADQSSVTAGASRGGVSSRPAGPPDPAPPAPSIPAVAFQAPQVLFQAPQPTVAPAAEAPPAAPSAEPAAADDENGGSRSGSRRRSSGSGSRAKADTEAAPPKQGARGSRRGAKATEAKTAEDSESTVAADVDQTFSNDQKGSASPGAGSVEQADSGSDDLSSADEESDDGGEEGGQSGRRRRRRGGRSRSRGRGNGSDDGADDSADDSAEAGTGQPGADASDEDASADSDDDGDDGENGNGPRRRRRKRRRGSAADSDKTSEDDPPDTVVHVREARPAGSSSSRTDDVRSVKGSTRLEAKKQRRREGRESGRRRPPVITESEFLARRESVERTMVVRQRGDRTQIAVLEDGVLVEHYVNRTTHASYVGNVYLGKVQNVLPSMEAAFVDIGKGRNAVLYAGEVNFDASGLEGQSKRIESALKSGQSILVQVTKDPVGHKGARLTSQVSLPGRYLVYVPGASMTGISRKLPDTERTRLKKILKKVMPEDAGVIVRTAAEGATEEELERDVNRLAAQWESIERKTKTASAPDLLYGEPDLTVRVIRDVFNEDFSQLIVSGDDGWAEVDDYVSYVAPHLADRLEHWENPNRDVFAEYRVDEQLGKALERKVWLPSGGSLVIDRTEAMTVIDVNTGKFTGQGGNLEETVTRNNLEAAEEIVRQLRLRDVGGIIVIDFIDMVLESNRDLVLRRLLECLARDRTKHQVAEVTSLGLVQMTRKRVGAGLLEAFSEPCECCNGRGVHVSLDLADIGSSGSGSGSGQSGQSNGRGRHGSEAKSNGNGNGNGSNGGGGNGGNGGNGESKPGEGRRSRNRRRGNRQDQAPSPAMLAGSVATDDHETDDHETANYETADYEPGTPEFADSPAAPPASDFTAATPAPAASDTPAATDTPVTTGTPELTGDAAPTLNGQHPAATVAPTAPEPTAASEPTPGSGPTWAPDPAAAPPAPESTPTPDPAVTPTSEVTPAPEATAAPTIGVGPDLEATEVPALGTDPAAQDPETPTEGH
jgi:ribonuclease E